MLSSNFVRTGAPPRFPTPKSVQELERQAHVGSFKSLISRVSQAAGEGSSRTAPRSFRVGLTFFAPEPDRGLQFQTHTHVRIGNTVERLAELTRIVLVGDELTIRNRKLCVVSWDDARLPNFFGPPAYVHHAILLRSRGDSFGLPKSRQRLNALTLQRAGTHLSEAEFEQLPADHALSLAGGYR